MATDNFWNFYFENNFESDNDIKTLPLCHNTNYESAEAIINEGYFKPSMCPVLEKEAVFFFYGKPYYFNEASMIAPVMMAFKCLDEKFDDFNWFPLDSGSTTFLKTMFPKFKIEISKEELKDSYTLNKNDCINYIKNHISTFFNNNTGYYNEKCVLKYDDLCEYCTNSQVFKIHQIINKKENQYSDHNSQYLDKRVTSIEAYSENPVPLSELELVFYYGPKHQKKYILKKLGVTEESKIYGGTYTPFASSPFEQLRIGIECFYEFLKKEEYFEK